MLKRNRKIFAAVGFVVWSATMVLVGTGIAEFGPGVSYADEAAAALVRLDSVTMAGNGLGEFEPYAPGRANFDARGNNVYTSPDRKVNIGVWEAQPGDLTIETQAADELMYVLDGKIILTDAQGKAETYTYTPGQGVVVPKGWQGTFSVPEGVRKMYFIYNSGD